MLRMTPRIWFMCTLHARYFILSISIHQKLRLSFYKIQLYPSLCVPYSAGVGYSVWHTADTHIFVVLMNRRTMSYEC